MHSIINWKSLLQHHWQKPPVLIRQAVSDFINPISPEDLAKLIIEKELECQLIQKIHGKHQLIHQAFHGYASLGQRNWSIQVEAINHWHKPAQELMFLFRTFPDWYTEEMAVSFSLPGGGLGLQTKNSDILVIQGMGCSRWRVGDRLLSTIPDSFEAILDEELLSGDVLYVPAKFPYESISSEATMSYRIDFWTDNSLRVIRHFTEYLSDQNHKGIEYYSDPALLMRDDPTEILPKEITALQKMMTEFLIQERDHLEIWFVQQMSQASYDLPVAPAAQVYKPAKVQKVLKQGNELNRLMGLRMLHIGDRYFINGESLTCDYADIWNILARNIKIDEQMINQVMDDLDFLEQLTLIINKGYWYF